MPKWMEPYRQFLREPDRAEEYMDCDGKNCNIVVNGPRALLCTGMHEQIGLLERLQKEKRLVKP